MSTSEALRSLLYCLHAPLVQQPAVCAAFAAVVRDDVSSLRSAEVWQALLDTLRGCTYDHTAVFAQASRPFVASAASAQQFVLRELLCCAITWGRLNAATVLLEELELLPVWRSFKLADKLRREQLARIPKVPFDLTEEPLAEDELFFFDVNTTVSLVSEAFVAPKHAASLVRLLMRHGGKLHWRVSLRDADMVQHLSSRLFYCKDHDLIELLVSAHLGQPVPLLGDSRRSELLQCVARCGSVATLERLLDRQEFGRSINEVFYQHCPLSVAADCRRLDIMRVLCDRGAIAVPPIGASWYRSPVDCAVTSNLLKDSSCCLKGGCGIQASGRRSCT